MQRTECSRRRDKRVLRVAFWLFIVLKPERPFIKSLDHTPIKCSVSSTFWYRRTKKKQQGSIVRQIADDSATLERIAFGLTWNIFHIQFNLHKTVDYDFFPITFVCPMHGRVFVNRDFCPTNVVGLRASIKLIKESIHNQLYPLYQNSLLTLLFFSEMTRRNGNTFVSRKSH